MSWMGAIHLDCTELVELVHKTPADEDPGIVGEVIQHVHGWVTPTVAGLACSLITSGQPADLERARRLLGGT